MRERFVRGSAVWVLLPLLGMLSFPAWAREFHVSVKGDDHNDGSAANSLRTISAAAKVAQAGDVITVHAGTYRERVTPPRGGESDEKRIVYQAAPGEEVVIKGSEVVREWKKFAPGVWKAVVPNSVFGKDNPYQVEIVGDWFNGKGRPHHTGEVYLNGKSLWETNLIERVLDPQPGKDIRDVEGSTYTWFAEVDGKNTYIYANFHEHDPTRELVEVNVRDACFYPDRPGRNYITVRGFRMMHAATQWAAPTAEQIGLIGTNWSKGWIIERNVVSDSKCACISLGKDRATGHNVWTNDPRKDGATHYNETIVRALEEGWSKETIGSHIVRENEISHCEQAGIVGSLGAVFSRISNNNIHDTWEKRQFGGAEMAGIKLHAAIDVVIENNRIYRAGRGLWMDWMAQGTRITHNVLYENTTDDLFVEVDHGPFVVDHNLFLSGVSLRDVSEGGAYVNNLMTGRIYSSPEPRRSTPYHKPHSTALAGLNSTAGGDDRFYNNIFVGGGSEADTNPLRTGSFGLWVYNHREYPLQTGGNVYLRGARPYAGEVIGLNLPECDPKIRVVEEGARVYVRMNLDPRVGQVAAVAVNTAMLGRTKAAGLPYENADGSPLVMKEKLPGPFLETGSGDVKLKIWGN